MAVKGWGELWPAPAKLNLMLRITGRREDGYHLLQTVFQIIDLNDWISFYPLDQDAVELLNPIPGVPEQDDLMVRAARLLKQHTGYVGGVRIGIEKNLPMGGGLGGGSSDAATSLVALNHLWGLGLSRQVLMQLGLQLGADVPVFIYGHSAWAEGVGEDLTAIELPEAWFVVIKPDCHVNTGAIFSSDQLTRDSKPITMADFIAGDARNDCTSVVSDLYLPVKEALNALSKYGEARLTGTGACVFVCFKSMREAQVAYSELKKDWLVYVAKANNQSSLYTKLEQYQVN